MNIYQSFDVGYTSSSELKKTGYKILNRMGTKNKIKVQDSA